MPTTAVLSGTIDDLIGSLDPKYLARITLVIEANTPGSLLLDTAGNRHLAGAKRIPIDKNTGAYSATLVTTNSADIVPTTGRLYRATLIYPSGTPGAGNVTQVSGWFQLTANASLADIWPGLATTEVATTVYENMTDSLMTGIDSNSASGFRVQQDARLSATFVGMRRAPTARIPIALQTTIEPTGATTPDAGVNTVAFSLDQEVGGDFVGIDGSAPGLYFGFNNFVYTGDQVGDCNGLTNLYGALVESNVRLPVGAHQIGVVRGLRAEANFYGAASGATVGSMISMDVAAPVRKDGAVAGTATNVYGLHVEAVTALGGAGETYSIKVDDGGDVLLGGRTFVGDTIASLLNADLHLASDIGQGTSRSELFLLSENNGSGNGDIWAVLRHASAAFSIRNESFTPFFEVEKTGELTISGPLNFNPATTGTAPSAGGAGALPATPWGYLTAELNGTPVKIPYYPNA